MPLPPERISVKRRRQEEPVNTLILDDGSFRDNKRHFTDFVFQRLRQDPHHVTVTKNTPAQINREDRTEPEPDRSAYGIPSIKSTKPGDEVDDFTKYKASQEKQKISEPTSATEAGKLGHDKSILNYFTQQAKQARRFHLTRDVSVLKPNAAGGIRRRRLDIRPPLATFVERHRAQHITSHGSGDSSAPQDRILRTTDDRKIEVAEQKLAPESIIDKKTVQTFVKPDPLQTKLGRSIRDDPSTWDHESDQLADELSKLAFELDPDAAQWASESESEPEMIPEAKPPPSIQPQTGYDAMSDDDYVLDTYIRVKHSDGFKHDNLDVAVDFGVLIIDEEDEDLWDRYVQSDVEDDWDEDDGDSNAEDNPRNDYPEDEVSTDDEYGHNVYQYRQNTSDDDDFDDKDD